MIKKSISIILALAVLLCLSGCEKSKKKAAAPSAAETAAKTHNPSTMTLLFNKTDSLNPYTAKTENNRLLTRLIFEPLVLTDNDLNPVYRLAKEVKLDGKTCSVTIKDTVFSDGTAVTASDVIYSYNLAKNYGGLYSSHLYEVNSITAVSNTTVSFSLSRPDPYFVSLLDFPILKSGSDKATDSDGNLKTPVGCGRYTPTDDAFVLAQNGNYHGKKGDIKEIKLIHAPDNDSVSHYIEIGATDLYYSDLSGENIIRMSGKRTDINLNTLVYLGINASSPAFKEKYFRYAISSAVDRTALCRDAFFNSASPAAGYFNSALTKTKAFQSLKPASDLEITVDNLKKMGYNDKNTDGYYVDANGKHFVIRLLVNKESNSKLLAAKLIASQLKSAGIEIKVVECPYAEFLNLISTNAFDLYLGEVSILPNFDMSPLVIKGGSVAYGLTEIKPEDGEKDKEDKEDTEDGETAEETKDDPVKLIYDEYWNGTVSITDVAGTLLTEMPQIPLLFKHGLLFSNESIQNIAASESDVFLSIEDYKIN
ncbi:MAG: hypothetical protein J5766_00045 [Clostridia bacterium]|nr:hypothetical protein [Clostridia bacterium]